MDTNPIEMICQDLVELVTEYLSDRLAVEDRVRFEEHLLTCPPCTAYLAQMRTTLELASALGRASPTPDVGQELIGVFRRWHQK